mmetsp:Transcript_5308/g.6323  ORF Transcript_5308/g.6323 Transcript_5308/m.6323 type:complete len:80 (-) Transcript_5308:1220-1459(-)
MSTSTMTPDTIPQYGSQNDLNQFPMNTVNNELKPTEEQKVKIDEFDHEVMAIISEETDRQRSSIDLIASSNIPIPEMNE